MRATLCELTPCSVLTELAGISDGSKTRATRTRSTTNMEEEDDEAVEAAIAADVLYT